MVKAVEGLTLCSCHGSSCRGELHYVYVMVKAVERALHYVYVMVKAVEGTYIMFMSRLKL